MRNVDGKVQKDVQSLTDLQVNSAGSRLGSLGGLSPGTYFKSKIKKPTVMSG